jgi:hypothetical protein
MRARSRGADVSRYPAKMLADRCDTNEVDSLSVKSASRRSLLAAIGLISLVSGAEGASAAGRKKPSGDGKWAQHYGEFEPEEISGDGFVKTPSGLSYKEVRSIDVNCSISLLRERASEDKEIVFHLNGARNRSNSNISTC